MEDGAREGLDGVSVSNSLVKVLAAVGRSVDGRSAFGLVSSSVLVTVVWKAREEERRTSQLWAIERKRDRMD